MTIQEQLQAAQADNARLSAELEAANATLASGNAELQQQLEAANANLETARAEAAQLSDNLTSATARIAELEAEARTAEARALEIAAAQGIPQADVEVNAGTTEPQTAEEIVAAFRAMPAGSARSEFYNKHRALLKGKLL